MLFNYNFSCHSEMTDAAEVRAAERVLSRLLGVKLNGFRFSLVNRFVDTEITQLESVSPLDAFQIDVHEGAGFHVNLVRRETESFRGHRDCLVRDA